MMQRAICAVLLVWAAACGGGGTDAGGGPDGGVGWSERGCAPIYDPADVPRFDVEIDAGEWAALADEYENWMEREAAGLPLKPYHPLTSFRWKDLEKTDAMIRLKGSRSWEGGKMQFQISFNETNPDGRFIGLRKVLLDAPPYDPTLLRDRLAWSWLADLGLPAACANSAVLYVNGGYYGIYSNIEKIDKEFLDRSYDGMDEDGPLYKYGRDIASNDENIDQARLDQFWEGDFAAVQSVADLDQMVASWAAEAVMPQGDGFFAGRGNYYLYDHPTRGFIMFLWDLDQSFDGYLEPRTDPILYLARSEVKFRQFDMVMNDATWRGRYLEEISKALDRFDVEALQARIDAWAQTIDQAVADDPSKPFSADEHRAAVEFLRDWLVGRRDFVASWLACQRGDDDSDGDGDGIRWCDDCDETTCAP